jgi:hypothetical protein
LSRKGHIAGCAAARSTAAYTSTERGMTPRSPR